jgi:hypothetical protein
MHLFTVNIVFASFHCQINTSFHCRAHHSTAKCVFPLWNASIHCKMRLSTAKCICDVIFQMTNASIHCQIHLSTAKCVFPLPNASIHCQMHLFTVNITFQRTNASFQVSRDKRRLSARLDPLSNFKTFCKCLQMRWVTVLAVQHIWLPMEYCMWRPRPNCIIQFDSPDRHSKLQFSASFQEFKLSSSNCICCVKTIKDTAGLSRPTDIIAHSLRFKLSAFGVSREVVVLDTFYTPSHRMRRCSYTTKRLALDLHCLEWKNAERASTCPRDCRVACNIICCQCIWELGQRTWFRLALHAVVAAFFFYIFFALMQT